VPLLSLFVRTAIVDAYEKGCSPLLRAEERVLPGRVRRRRTLTRSRRTACPEMIRLVCPHCHMVFLRIVPAEDGEEIVCPRCNRPFIPEEEEWVDPEDE